MSTEAFESGVLQLKTCQWGQQVPVAPEVPVLVLIVLLVVHGQLLQGTTRVASVAWGRPGLPGHVACWCS